MEREKRVLKRITTVELDRFLGTLDIAFEERGEVVGHYLVSGLAI